MQYTCYTIMYCHYGSTLYLTSLSYIDIYINFSLKALLGAESRPSL